MNPPFLPSGPDPFQAISPELAEQANFLRALARQIVRDASQADDLAQETLIAGATSAAVGTQLDRRSSRPWLARVLRRKAYNERRSSARRADREGAAARPEAEPSSFDSVAQLDLAERLLAHVRSLEPEVRDAVVARFYHGESFALIAARENAPVTTIQSRVTRGLEALRRRLDKDSSGGPAAWLGGMTALGGKGRALDSLKSSSMGTWWSAGPIAMAVGAVAAMTAAVLGVTGWATSPEGSPSPPREGTAALVGAGDTSAAQSSQASSSLTRATAGSRAERRVALASAAGGSSEPEAFLEGAGSVAEGSPEEQDARQEQPAPANSGTIGRMKSLAEPTADAGMLEVQLPSSLVKQRVIGIAPSLADPNREFSRMPAARVELKVDASGHGEAHGLPVGQPLCLYTNSTARAYTHQKNGLAYSLEDAFAASADDDLAPIVIPASGHLSLKLPAEIATYVDVTVLGESGEPAPDSKVSASAEWREEEGAYKYLDLSQPAREGRFLIPLPFADAPKPIVVQAVAPITPGPDFDPTDVPLCMAICEPLASKITEVTIQLSPSRKESAHVAFPASVADPDYARVWIERTLLSDPDADGRRLALYRQRVPPGKVNADGHFEWQMVPDGFYRIAAHHPDFEDAVLETDLHGESPPLQLRFERRPPTAITVNYISPPGTTPSTLCVLNYGPSPSTTRRHLLRSSRRSRTVPATPGRVWMHLMTHGPHSTTLSSRANGFVTIQPGANELTIQLETDHTATGTLPAPAPEDRLFLHVLAEETSGPLQVGTNAVGSPTEWITVAPNGRYRFRAPYGDYLFWTGTRTELRTNRPRTRQRLRFNAQGLSPL
ncbi:RNA polymerase sigma factor [Planctomycetes bacterium Poly30]|uniref:RNA polymerase sigma factor n=1 Tax=Saltatorellus ferox TaxID=2528018 RepID=A0A518EMC5_9BACT|nr:RNA polymerase sigma factor [Planctomycetes bacterium Poly30]